MLRIFSDLRNLTGDTSLISRNPEGSSGRDVKKSNKCAAESLFGRVQRVVQQHVTWNELKWGGAALLFAGLAYYAARSSAGSDNDNSNLQVDIKDLKNNPNPSAKISGNYSCDHFFAECSPKTENALTRCLYQYLINSLQTDQPQVLDKNQAKNDPSHGGNSSVMPGSLTFDGNDKFLLRNVHSFHSGKPFPDNSNLQVDIKDLKNNPNPSAKISGNYSCDHFFAECSPKTENALTRCLYQYPINSLQTDQPQVLDKNQAKNDPSHQAVMIDNNPKIVIEYRGTPFGGTSSIMPGSLTFDGNDKFLLRNVRSFHSGKPFPDNVVFKDSCDNAITCKGSYTDEKGDEYIGDFNKQGQFHGRVRIFHKNRGSTECFYKNGMREGPSRFMRPNDDAPACSEYKNGNQLKSISCSQYPKAKEDYKKRMAQNEVIQMWLKEKNLNLWIPKLHYSG